MTHHASLLRALLLAAAVPAVGCGGKTETLPENTGGAGGSVAGSGGSGGSSAGSGGSTAGSGGSSAGSGGQAGAPQVPCDDPKPVLVGGKPTGFQTCASGAVTRPDAITCPSLIPRPDSCGEGVAGGCTKDSDCTEKPNGYCGVIEFFGGDAPEPPSCSCQYGCTKDADCGEGSICLCGDPVGRCTQATCASDGSCPEGGCAAYESSPGCSFTAFACQTLTDECVSNEECQKKSEQTPFCTVKEGKRVCSGWECAAGRPLWVEEAPRFAPLQRRQDW